MHRSSYEKMTAFRKEYLLGRENSPLKICDLGSQDVNGSYRDIFSESGWSYSGLDMAPGKNVDIVLTNPYAWKKVSSGSVDVLISGQAFEHIQYFWITMLEIARVLKPGGLCCILAPSSGPEHRYPLDCWRFYPDGMASMAHFAQMEVIDVQTQWQDHGYLDGSDWWHDSMLVCKKPELGRWWQMKSGLKRWLQHRAMTIGMK